MSTRELALVVLLVALVSGCARARAVQQEGPNLGRQATEAQIAGWDISILPDGAGLPTESGTPSAGAVVYAQKCQSCHGEKGVGGPNDRLIGGQGTLATATPVRTIGSYWPYATTVFDYVRRAMPYTQPHSLTNDEAYAVTACVLNLNGIIGADAAMSGTSCESSVERAAAREPVALDRISIASIVLSISADGKSERAIEDGGQS